VNTGYFISRLSSAILVIVGVISIVFLLIHLVPGDPVEVMLGESAHAADREALRPALGLDLPIQEQLFNYFRGHASLTDLFFTSFYVQQGSLTGCLLLWNLPYMRCCLQW